MSASDVDATVLGTDSAATTRIVHPSRRIFIRLLWLLVVLVDVVSFIMGVPDYLSSLHEGCICDYAQLTPRNGVIVVTPIPNGPLAGVAQNDDVLVAVNGKPVPPGATFEMAAAMLSGEPTTSVTITLRTENAPARDLTVSRSARWHMIALGLKLDLPLNAAIAIAFTIQIIVFVGFAGVGLLIGWKRSDDWMALYGAGVLLSYGLISTLVFPGVSSPDPSPIWDLFVAIVTSASFNFLLIFPDGHYRPRWIPVVALLFTVWELTTEMGIVALDDVVSTTVGLAFIVAALIIMGYRYVRFFSPYRRQQTKWLLYGIGVALLINQLLSLIGYLLEGQNFQLWRLFQGVENPLAQIVLLLIPLGFAFAALHYRLWDIDLTLNRSLVYGVVTVLLGVVFIAAFFIAQLVLSSILGTQQAAVAAAISAAITVLCFNPARKQVRTLIDRRIYHFRFDLNELNQAQKPVEVHHPGALTGKVIGTYELLGVLGKGGMGEVYQGKQGKRVAAIKILPSELAAQPDFVKRFEREAKTLAAINHPNIVKVYDAGQSDGIYYMAMEYIVGQELSTVIHQRLKLSYEEVCPLADDFGSALDYAHQHGFVHRDIKPSNVMLRQAVDTARPDVVLMDFGIAKIQDAQTSLTGTGAIGTIGYMAPEQISAAGMVDGRADIYALGVVLFETLTGELPFKGSPAQILFAHLQQPPPDARELVASIPREVARALQKAMAKKAEDRFQTAGEFAAAINTVIAPKPIDAHRSEIGF